MEDQERTEIRIKVYVPEDQLVYWLRRDNEGFDLVSAPREATLYDSMDQAMDTVEDVEQSFPDAVLSVVEEGWTGDWSGVNPADVAFWRS